MGIRFPLLRAVVDRDGLSRSMRLLRLVRRRFVLEVVETEAVSGSSLLGEKRSRE